MLGGNNAAMEKLRYSRSQSSPSPQKSYGKSVRKFFARLSLKSEQKSYEVEPTKTFIVQSIGTVERHQPGDEGLTECLKTLYITAKRTKHDLLKVKICISGNSVSMRGIGGKIIEDQDEDIIIPFSRITYVIADRKHQLLAFNDQVCNKPRRVISYAFICSDAESSATIASTLSTAFQVKLGRRRTTKPTRTPLEGVL